MRNPVNVLNSLSGHSSQSDYTYERLYRNLYNPQFFYNAYQRIYAKPGNMTAGTDKHTIDGMSLKKIDMLIESLKDESYKPKIARRQYIPKKNGKMCPLGIPPFDDKFIRLIRKFHRAGYMEEWQFHKTYSGTPQGGIISPILANIYLDKLDKYIKKYAETFNKGIKRAVRPEYTSLSGKIQNRKKKLQKITDEEQRQSIISEIKQLKQVMLRTERVDAMAPDLKRLRYERYADEFLIGVIGSKEDCRRIKQDIKDFLAQQLHLELSDEKTLITNAKEPAKFLGYDITVRWSQEVSRDKNGSLARNRNGTVILKIPPNVIRDKLLKYKALSIVKHNGREIWKPQSRNYLIQQEDLEILLQYNSEIRGLYNYYVLALNCGVLNNFKYIMQYSMFKTLANKHKCSKKKIIMQMRMGKDFGINVRRANGKEHAVLFYNGGFSRKKISYKDCDVMPKGAIYYSRTKLTDRLAAQRCELCGKEGVPLEMHHVRKLKDLKGKKHWEVIMIARNRKTIAVCEDCHSRIHNGTMD